MYVLRVYTYVTKKLMYYVYVFMQRRMQNSHVIITQLRKLVVPPPQGGPDMLSSLRNNHMTILHSSLHKYILAVHDLHCIPRYISTYT